MEKTMNRIKSLIAISAFSLLILGLPAIASAQWRDRDNDNYGNGRYNRNISSTVRNLKNRARQFERQVDRSEDRNDDRWNNRRGNRYDNLEDLARSFKNATDDLEDAYGRGRNMGNSSDEARRVLDIGSQIDRAISNSRSGNRLQNEWNAIEQDLRVIANAYGYNYNNRNRNRNGGWRNNFPLPF